MERFRTQDDKRRTVVGEMLARQMIAEYCHVSEENIAFSVNENGKPFVADLPVEFNISHSGDLVICAVSDTPVGADIEKMRKISDAVIRRVCTPKELDYVLETGISALEKEKRFFKIWTFKEAYSKCIGSGMRAFDSIDYFDKAFSNRRQFDLIDDYTICIVYQAND